MTEPLRYAAFFGLMGAALAVAAAFSTVLAGSVPLAWLLVAVEAYLALGLAAVALAYVLNHCGVPIEETLRHPRRAPWLDGLLLPYRWLAWATVALLRRHDSMAMMDPVGDRLFVGRRPVPADRARLVEAGVTSILNLCAEFPRRPWPGGPGAPEIAFLPVLDGAAPSPRQFRAAVDWIAARHAEGHSILVHCAQGRGRSVTVAAAALCRLGLAGDPDDALARITASRPKARPSQRQRRALAQFLLSPSASHNDGR